MKQKEMARLGGLARWKNKTEEEKKAHMSMMGKLGGKPKKQAISEPVDK